MKRKNVNEINDKSSIIKSIYSEEIKEIYKGRIYTIDLDNNHNHFLTDIIGDNNKIFKENDDLYISNEQFRNILLSASFKSIKDILFYKSYVGPSRMCSMREIITRESLPYYTYNVFPEIINIRRKNNINIPVFLYFNNKNSIALSSELENYLKYHTDPNNFNAFIEYFDSRVELKKQLKSIYEQAFNDYISFLESREYSENYKIEKIKQKYKQFFNISK